MSHFSKIKAELRDEECLLRALDDLGFEYEKNGTVRGFAGQTMRADVVIRQQGGYDLGFIREGEEFQMAADLWGLKLDKDRFLEQVKQRYACQVVLKQAQTEGFTIVEQEESEDGSIRIVCEKAEPVQA